VPEDYVSESALPNGMVFAAMRALSSRMHPPRHEPVDPGPVFAMEGIKHRIGARQLSMRQLSIGFGSLHRSRDRPTLPASVAAR
jgi:hypothetical protein